MAQSTDQALDRTAPGDAVELRPHWRAYGVWYVLALLLATGPLHNPEALLKPLHGIVLAGAVLAGILFHSLTSRLTVSPEGITRRGGLFDRRPLHLALGDLGSVTVSRGLVFRILGLGVLILKPKGQGQAISFWGVDEPQERARQLRRLAGLPE